MEQLPSETQQPVPLAANVEYLKVCKENLQLIEKTQRLEDKIRHLQKTNIRLERQALRQAKRIAVLEAAQTAANMQIKELETRPLLGELIMVAPNGTRTPV